MKIIIYFPEIFLTKTGSQNFKTVKFFSLRWRPPKFQNRRSLHCAKSYADHEYNTYMRFGKWKHTGIDF